MKRISFVFLMIALSACGTTGSLPRSGGLDELTTLMTGTFNSAEQAARDSSYFDITLHMYPIWPGREDGRWLYVEQAVSASRDRPYRQRIYRLTQAGPDAFVSTIYELPDPEAYAGRWRTPDDFRELTPEDLLPREGCDVYLTREGKGVYRGATEEGTCASNLRGAAYATSRVEIRKGVLLSWDQGFNAGGEQVWGAEKGGYVFKETSTRDSP